MKFFQILFYTSQSNIINFFQGSAIYRCKKCKLGFPVHCAMVQHLRVGHQITDENVDDFMEDHRREFAIPYLVSWRRCFPQIQEAALETHSIGELIGRPPRPKRADLPEAFQRVIQQQRPQPYRTRTARNLLEVGKQKKFS